MTVGDERVVDGLDVDGVEPDRGTDAGLSDGCEVGAWSEMKSGPVAGMVMLLLFVSGY